MSEQVTAQDLTAKEKSALFWASFFSLAAAGFGFAFRVPDLDVGRIESHLDRVGFGRGWIGFGPPADSHVTPR